MNRLDVQVRWDRVNPYMGDCLVTSLWVDDEVWADGLELVADLAALQTSVDATGRFVIAVCTCEVEGCGSTPVQVSQDGEAVQWQNWRGGIYRFDRSHYRAIIDGAINRGRQLVRAFDGELPSVEVPGYDLPWIVLPGNAELLRR